MAVNAFGTRAANAGDMFMRVAQQRRWGTSWGSIISGKHRASHASTRISKDCGRAVHEYVDGDLMANETAVPVAHATVDSLSQAQLRSCGESRIAASMLLSSRRQVRVSG